MSEAPKRLAPTQDTLIRLFARSGNQCAFPECSQPLIDEDDIFIGQVCHIEGVKGERFNISMSNEQRRSLDNLVIFCYPHHKKTDNVDKFSVKTLKEIKANHEIKWSTDFKISDKTLLSIYEQLKEIKEDTEEIISYAKKNEQQNINLYNELQNLATLVSSQLLPSPGFLREIEAIEELKKTKNYNEAILRFERIKSEDWTKLSNLEKYKVTANIGLCLLSLQQGNSAANYLIEAVQYQPENHRALSFAALGHAIHSDKLNATEYARKAIFIENESPYAYVALIMVNNTQVKVDKLIQTIPPALLNNPEICFALGMALVKHGNYSESIEWFEKILTTGDGVNFFLKGIMAVSILHSFSEPFLLYSNQLTEKSKLEIRKAISLLKEAWEEAKTTNATEKNTWLLVNLSFAYRVLNDPENTYTYIRKAVDNGDEDFDVNWNYSVACFESNREEEALVVLNQLMETALGKDSHRTQLFLSEILFKQKNIDQAIAKLESLLKLELDFDILIGARRLLIECHIQLVKIEIARSICVEMIENESEAVHGGIFLSRIYQQEGKFREAEITLDKACQFISPNVPKIILQQISSEYIALECYDKGIKILEDITDTSLYTGLTKLLLKCYFKAGDINKALHVCDILTQTYGPLELVTELQCHIYCSINDTNKAIEISLQHLAVYPDDQPILLRLIFIYGVIKKWTEIELLLKRHKLKEQLLTIEEGFNVSLMYITMGKVEKGLELAYRIRQNNLENAEAHESYFSLMLQQKARLQKYIAADVIEVNTRVIVEWEKKGVDGYLILADPDKNIPFEISISTPLANKLLQKKTGDHINHYQEGYGIVSGEIKEVLSKYVVAESESLLLLQTQFKDESGFQTFKIGETGDFLTDFKPIIDMIDKGHEHKVNASAIYQEGVLTIGALSQGFKKSIIETWAMCVSDEKMGVRSDWIYSMNDLSWAIQNLNSSKGLVIDIISLLTLSSLNLLNVLELLPCKIIVTAPCLDIIHSYIETLRQHQIKESVTVIKEGNNYFKHITTSNEINEGIDHYVNLLAWIDSYAETIPCKEALNINSIKKQEMDKVLGKSTIDSILTAKEPEHMLLSDETSIRSIADNSFNVRSLSSYLILHYCRETDLIEDNIFCEGVAGLISLNYKTIPISAKSLMILLKSSSYKISPPFAYALDTFSNCSEQSAILVAGTFLNLLFTEENTIENNETIVIKVLDHLTIGRNSLNILVKLIQYLQSYRNDKLDIIHQIILDYGHKIGVFKSSF